MANPGSSKPGVHCSAMRDLAPMARSSYGLVGRKACRFGSVTEGMDLDIEAVGSQSGKTSDQVAIAEAYSSEKDEHTCQIAGHCTFWRYFSMKTFGELRCTEHS